MISPFDTIREALVGHGPIESWADREEAALAALTEVEQQLAAHDREVAGLWQLRDTQEARAVATETALAEANGRMEVMSRVGVREVDARKAAEQRANDLADALRAVKHELGHVTQSPAEAAAAALVIARAALEKNNG